MFKHILVPTDGSDLSKLAVERAISFATETSAKVTFFHAQPDYPLPVFGEGAVFDAISPNEFQASIEAEAKRILQQVSEQAQQAGIEFATDTLAAALPWEAIIDAANRHRCDLIFMASHGRSGLAGLLIGSETHKVLTHSKIPVLVYREAE